MGISVRKNNNTFIDLKMLLLNFTEDKVGMI